MRIHERDAFLTTPGNVAERGGIEKHEAIADE
jgi:hypothetical protein